MLLSRWSVYLISVLYFILHVYVFVEYEEHGDMVRQSAQLPELKVGVCF